MDEETLARLAYDGMPPESAQNHEWLLYYRLRDIYAAVRSGSMNADKGRAMKRAAVDSFHAAREAFERNARFWTKIELAAVTYAKSEGRTEAGDAFFEAVYGLRPSRKHDNDIPIEKGQHK